MFLKHGYIVICTVGHCNIFVFNFFHCCHIHRLYPPIVNTTHRFHFNILSHLNLICFHSLVPIITLNGSTLVMYDMVTNTVQ